MDQAHGHEDFHNLVTLEPSLRDYVHLPSSAAVGSSPTESNDQTERPRRLSSPQYPAFSSSVPGQEPGLSNVHSRTASMSQRRSTRWPFLSMSSRGSGASSRQSTSIEQTDPQTISGLQDSSAHGSPGNNTLPGPAPPTFVLTAQKDSDDVDDSHEVGRRRSVNRRNTATSTRVNRLFTMQSPTTSREPSYQKPPPNFSYKRSQPGETASLPHHLLERGLMQGKHSDIMVKVFDRDYALHRIILDRAPFFASALSPPWCEASQKEIELHPEEIDSNITQRAFELALKRLYGCSLRAEEDEEAVCLFATGCWLEMQDLINDSVAAIMKSMGPPSLAPVIQVVSANYYGRPGDRILESAKAMLCRNGADMPISSWDGIPVDLICELIGGDGFFISDEWQRWRLAKRLLDRRLKAVARQAGLWTSHSSQAPSAVCDRAIRPKVATYEEAMTKITKEDALTRRWEALYSHPDVRPLLTLLDEGIHYVHMDFEQLQSTRGTRDVLGVPVMAESTIQDALWSNLELRQKVLNAPGSGLSLGLQQHEDQSTPADDMNACGDPLGALSPKEGLKRRSSGTADAFRTSNLGAHHYRIPSTDCNIVLGGDDAPIYTTRKVENTREPRATSHLVTQTDDADQTEVTSYDVEQANGDASTKETSATYSTYPPFRFAVELPNAKMLKDRRKVFSHTVFYAGSHWNVYIKKVKSGSKHPHLGVYLHRAPQQQTANSTSPPTHGAVDRRIGALEQRMQNRIGSRLFQRPHSVTTHHGDPSLFGQSSNQLMWPSVNTPDRGQVQQYDPSSPGQYDPTSPPYSQTHSRFSYSSGPFTTTQNTTSYSETSSDAENNDDRAPAEIESLTYQPPRHRVPTLGPYVDSRPKIKTYFKIYSPSRGGRMLSVYESVPCDFNYSQSWGWKSSTLMADDDEDAEDDDVALPAAETSFVDDGDAGITEGKDGALAVSAGDASRRKSKNSGFRFVVVLGVV